jgi:hypothetical protein
MPFDIFDMYKTHSFSKVNNKEYWTINNHEKLGYSYEVLTDHSLLIITGWFNSFATFFISHIFRIKKIIKSWIFFERCAVGSSTQALWRNHYFKTKNVFQTILRVGVGVKVCMSTRYGYKTQTLTDITDRNDIGWETSDANIQASLRYSSQYDQGWE